MKYKTLAFLSTIIVTNCAIAQMNWIPKSIDILVPIKAHFIFSAYDPDLKNVYDSSFDDMYGIYFGTTPMDQPSTYQKIGDSVYISYTNIFDGGVRSLHFVIDTTEKKLKNYYDSYLNVKTYCPPDNQFNDYKEQYHLQYTYLRYFYLNDSTVVVNESRDSCMKALTSAAYQYSFSHIVNSKYQEYDDGKDIDMISLADDTTSYKCSLVFILSKPVNAVSKLRLFSQSTSIFNSIPDYSIYFSFLSSDHPQPLIMYDILGREVKRIEIASGVTEYSLPKEQLKSGYYFARLGSQSASFIVN